MRLKIEPSKLKDMLTTGLIGGQLSNITAIITPNGLSFQDISLGTLGVYAIYAKDYFPQGGFENQNESVTVTKFLLDVLNKGFKNDEQIELYTDNNRLYVNGARDKYEDIIPEITAAEFPVKMKSEQYGIIPAKTDLTQALIAKFAVDELNFMDAESYQFISDGKKLDVRIEQTDTSSYTKTLKPLMVANMPAMTAVFSGELFNAVLKPLTGEVWLIVTPDAMTISKKEKTFSITMLVAGKDMV